MTVRHLTKFREASDDHSAAIAIGRAKTVSTSLTQCTSSSKLSIHAGTYTTAAVQRLDYDLDTD